MKKSAISLPEKSIRNHFYALIDALSMVRHLISLEVHRLTEKEIIEAVLNILIEHQDMKSCSLYLVKEQILEYAGGKDWDDLFGDDSSFVPPPQGRLRKVCEVREELMREAVRTKMLQHCPDCTNRIHQEEDESETGSYKFSSIMSLPIIASSKVLGVINVFHEHPDHFQNWHEHVLNLFCGVLGTAVENHRMFQSLNTGIEARKEELKVVNSRLQQEVRERKKIDSRAKHLTHFNELTGLPNRRSLINHLEKSLAHSIRNDVQGALLYIDLDHFKTINDSVGHDVGDMLLKQLGERLLLSIRADDLVAYLGGDEFAVLLQQLDRESEKAVNEAKIVSEKIREVVAEPHRINDHEYQTTVSIGVAMFPQAREGAYDILKHGEAAMHQAKEIRQSPVQLFRPSMQAFADERLQLEKDLHGALKRQEFLLHYQPQIDQKGRVIGAEALLRWKHPEQGIITPDRFIPVAEETGLIFSIGEWVLREASNHFRGWMGSGAAKSLCGLSVNVSPQQFHQSEFIEQVQRIILKAGADSCGLTLEVTEGAVIEDVEDTIRKMHSLKAIGVKFSIDDFGTGYSSLAYINRLPLDELKIDKSFVWEILESRKNGAIVDTIIAMSKLLGLKVVAEGVETLEQLNLLKEKGCMIFQGYHFSRPVPADEFAEILEQRDMGDSASLRDERRLDYSNTKG